MRHNVTFQSSLPVDMTAHPIGEELAIHVTAELRASGTNALDPENHDDFAWSIDTVPNYKAPWILLGYVGDGEYEWLAEVQSAIGFVGKLLGRTDQPERERLTRALHSILSSDVRFSNIRWHEGEFGAGWSASPDSQPAA